MNDTALPAPPTPAGPSPLARLARLLVRVTIAVVLGVLVGLGAYLGAPALYRSFIEPVQIHTQRIAELEAALASEQSQAARERAEILDRLAAAEGRQAAQVEALASLQEELRALSAAARAQGQDLESLDARAAALETALLETDLTLAGLQSALAGADTPTQQLARRIQMLRALELLTRARLWLMQENRGLAAEDIRLARSVVQETAATAPPAEAEALEPVLERLDLALRDLLLAPVLAADDLEIAWRLLLTAAAPQPPAPPTPELAGDTP